MYTSSNTTQPSQKTAEDVLEKRCGLTTVELKALSVPSSLRFLLGVEYDIVLCVTEIGSQRGFTLTFPRFSEIYRALLSLCAQRFSLQCDHLEDGSVLSGVVVMPLLRYADYLPDALHVEELLAFLQVEPARHAQRRTLPPLCASRCASGGVAAVKEEKPSAVLSRCESATKFDLTTGRSHSGRSHSSASTATTHGEDAKVSSTVAAAMLANQFDASFLDYGEYASESENGAVPGLGFYLMHDSGLSLATHSHLVMIHFHKGWTAAAALQEFQEFSGHQTFDLRFADDHNHSAGGLIVMPSLQDAYDLFDRYEDEDSDDEGDLLPFILRPVCPLVAVPSIEDTYLRRMREKYWSTIEQFWERFPSTRHCLVLSNLPPWVTLRNVLGWLDEETMPVAEAKLVEDDSPSHRHRAFVTFRSAAAARRALDMDGKSVRGYTIRVQVAPPYISSTRWGRVIMTSQANSTHTSPALGAQRGGGAAGSASGNNNHNHNSSNGGSGSSHNNTGSPHTSGKMGANLLASTPLTKSSSGSTSSRNSSKNTRINGCGKIQSASSPNTNGSSSSHSGISNGNSNSNINGNDSSHNNNSSSGSANHANKSSSSNGNHGSSSSASGVGAGAGAATTANNNSNHGGDGNHVDVKNGREAHDTKTADAAQLISCAASSSSSSSSSATAAVNTGANTTTNCGGTSTKSSSAVEPATRRGNSSNNNGRSNNAPKTDHNSHNLPQASTELHAKEDGHARRCGAAAPSVSTTSAAAAAAAAATTTTTSSIAPASTPARGEACNEASTLERREKTATHTASRSGEEGRVHDTSASHHERPPLHRSPLLTHAHNHTAKHGGGSATTTTTGGMMNSSNGNHHHHPMGGSGGIMALPQPRSRCKGEDEAHRAHVGESTQPTAAASAVRECAARASGGRSPAAHTSPSLTALAEASEALFLCGVGAGTLSSGVNSAHGVNHVSHGADVVSAALLTTATPPLTCTTAALPNNSNNISISSISNNNKTELGVHHSSLTHGASMLVHGSSGSGAASVSGSKDSAAIVAAAFASSALHVAGSAETKMAKATSHVTTLPVLHSLPPGSSTATTTQAALSPATGFAVASSDSLTTAKSVTPSLMNVDAKEFVPHFLLYPSAVAATTDRSPYSCGVNTMRSGGANVAAMTSSSLLTSNSHAAAAALGGVMPTPTLAASAPVTTSGFTVEGSGLLDLTATASLTSPPALPASLPSYSDVIQCCGGAASGTLVAVAAGGGAGDAVTAGFLTAAMPSSSFTHEFSAPGMVPPPYTLPPPYIEFADPVFAGSASKPLPHSAAATPKINHASSLNATTVLTASASLAGVASVSNTPVSADAKTMLSATTTSSFRHGPVVPPLPRSSPAATFAVTATAPPPYI